MTGGARCARLYSERQWWELRDFLEELSDSEKAVRSLKRLALGYQTTLKPACPLMIPATLQYRAALTGDDVLIVFEDDYMEIWADRMFDST